MNNREDISEADLELVLNLVHEKYGYDFTNYSRAHIKRRIANRIILDRLNGIEQIQANLQNDKKFAAKLLQDLSITVTEMFRDPGFYQSFRNNVVPILQTYPYIKIWHAGCSTGEEAYSMAILLHEEKLYEKATIYATDFNQHALNIAREGIFSNEVIREYTGNYQKFEGKQSFSDYYTSSYDHVIMNQAIKSNIVWANHNLVTDSVFAEVNVVLCRNVLIYFNHDLQEKVQRLFYDSLVNGGILCLGTKESLRFTQLQPAYSEVDKKYRIFKKKYEK